MSIFHKERQAGFTLLELLIASAVFSVVLLLLTFGLMQIGKNYYKGVTSSQTQSVARNVSDTIAQSIKYSDGVLTQGADYFCIGTRRFSYQVNKEQTGSAVGLVIDTTTSGCTAAAGSGQELLTSGMRVLVLDVEQLGTTNLYNVRVKIAKGADDLFVDNSGDHADVGTFDPAEARCVSGAGSQFCSISELYTQVRKRL